MQIITIKKEELIYSETLELSWNIEPNQTESNQIQPNYFELVRSNQIEFFLSSVRSNRTERTERSNR